MCEQVIDAGSVVFSNNDIFLVTLRIKKDLVLCRFISMSEPRHRADLDLTWVDLLDANLPDPRRRLRAVACYRQYASLQPIGQIGRSFLSLAVQALRREMAESDRQLIRMKWSKRTRSGGLKTE